MSGTVLYTLHINLMKYSYYPHFMRRKVRSGEAEEVAQGHTALKGYGVGASPGLLNHEIPKAIVSAWNTFIFFPPHKHPAKCVSSFYR